MATLENTILKVRADNATNWSTNNPTLENRELALDLTNNEIKIGVGNTWNATNNFIANNKAVKAAAQAASTAQSTATSANTTAQTAYNMAQQALNAGGRRMDIEIGGTIEEQGSELSIGNDFIKAYANYNIDCMKGLDGVTFGIDNFDLNTSEANDIIFNFYTKTDCYLKSTRFTVTIEDVQTNNSIFLVDANGIIQATEDQGLFLIPAGYYVRMLIHDTWMLKIEAVAITTLPQ